MSHFNPDMVKNIYYLSKKYLSDGNYLEIDRLLKIRGDLPEVVKFILSKLDERSKYISGDDANLIHAIASEYL